MSYLWKGGKPEEVPGTRCICNSLLANIGLGQVRPDGPTERPLLTAGTGTAIVADLVLEYGFDYTAADVLEFMLGRESSDEPREPHRSNDRVEHSHG